MYPTEPENGTSVEVLIEVSVGLMPAPPVSILDELSKHIASGWVGLSDACV